jgi:hypothetical protein
LRFSNPQDHDFRSFDEGRDSLTWLELHFAGGPGRDYRRDHLPSNRNLNLRHQAADAYREDPSNKLVPSTDAADYKLSFLFISAAGSKKQPVDLTQWNTMMPASRPYAAYLFFVDPLLDGWKTDAQLQGSISEF